MNQPEHISCIQCNSRLRSIFNEVGSMDIEVMDTSKTCQFFKKGQLIFEEGDYPHGLYCINTGKIKVTQTGIDGREHIVHLCKDGNVMGYRAVLSGDKYSCSSVALENSSVCFIPTKVFVSMVEKDPKLAFKIIHLFSNELKAAERNITDIAQKSVKERLAQGLLLLKESYGMESDNATLNIIMTREDIANVVGTVRETAIRLLFELEREGILALEGKKIKILDAPKLLRLANIID
jgi:CRP-like cAMP-binding protein